MEPRTTPVRKSNWTWPARRSQNSAKRPDRSGRLPTRRTAVTCYLPGRRERPGRTRSPELRRAIRRGRGRNRVHRRWRGPNPIRRQRRDRPTRNAPHVPERFGLARVVHRRNPPLGPDERRHHDAVRLAHEGKVQDTGQPKFLRGMARSRTPPPMYTYFTSPPRAPVMKVLTTIFAPIGRALGYRAMEAKYAVESFWYEHVELPDPDEIDAMRSASSYVLKSSYSTRSRTVRRCRVPSRPCDFDAQTADKRSHRIFIP